MPDSNKLTSGEQLSEEIALEAALLIRQLNSPIDSHVVMAVHALLRLLASDGLTIHAIVDCVQHSGESKPLNPAEMQVLYDKGFQDGHAAGVEYGRRSAVLAAARPFYTAASVIGAGVNGYSWQEVAAHCALNSHLFAGKELEFVESIAKQMQYRTPSEPQAQWLRDLFVRRCGGKIT